MKFFDSEMRKLVFDNKINMFHCKSCQIDYRLPFSLMYVNMAIIFNTAVQ